MSPSRAALYLLACIALSAQTRMNDHLFPIREGRKFGFIHRTGSVVVPPQYDAIGEPSEGRIRVTIGGLSGYIDLSGKLVIPAKYTIASDFQADRAVVLHGTQYALLDPTGALIADIPHRVLGSFHQGRLRVQAAGRPTLYGFVDPNGQPIIPPQFMPAGEFPDDPANLNFGGLKDEWCYFDRSGKIFLRLPMHVGGQLVGAQPFSNGRIRIKEGFTWGFKDASGTWAIPAKFNDAQDFKDGLAQVQDGAKWITIDLQGKTVDPDKRTLKPIAPPAEGLALASENDLLGWVDSRGKLAFPLRKYQEAHSFSAGLARFKLDGTYGYLDKSGNPKIPNQFPSAADFSHGLAAVQLPDGTNAYIDPQAKIVWKSAPLR